MSERKYHNIVITALISVGFTSMVAQVLLMRELLIVFYGNELSLGVTLAAWLFWGGVGSLVMGPFLGRRVKKKLFFFTIGEILLSIFLPVSIILTRLISEMLRMTSGEIIGTIPMVLSSFIVIAPVTFIGGTLFVLGCSVYREDHVEKAIPIGYVYILEAIGATIGGLAASFFLIRFTAGIVIMFLLSFANIILAFLLEWKKAKSVLIVSAVLILCFVTLMSFSQRLRVFTLERQWKTYKFITSENSIYQNITVVSREQAISFFTNGLIAFTVPDTASSEKKAHIPLLEHPDPKSVLVIEGGMSGVMREILKHPVESIDYVEIDPVMIKLASKYLDFNKTPDSRVTIINMDGRLFVKKTKSRYDVVILNLPEPHTAQINRFYTVEFFQELKDVLSEDGIVCFSIYSNPNYISEEAKKLYLSLRQTLMVVFADVIITPGETNYFLACKSDGVLTEDWRVLLERAKKRGVKTKYLREYYLRADFSPERFEYFRERLKSKKPIKVNSDFRPISYYYDMVFWSTYFSKTGYLTRRLLESITEKRTWVFLAVISVLLLLPLVLRRKGTISYGILVPIATTGFAEITFQVVTLLSFQILYGYVFYKLSFILTSYMLGLIIGGLWITRLMRRGLGTKKTFLLTQVSIVIYPLILPIVFLVFARFRGDFSNFVGSNIIFPLLPVIPGIIGGFQFPLANKLLTGERETKGTSAGKTYGFDLIGSCIGALLVSIFLIPVIGIPNTCFQVSVLNFAGLLLIVFSLYTFNRKVRPE